MSADVIVVGGGVIGIAIAYSLILHGKKVLIIERRRPGAGATEKAGGMLAPLEEAAGEGPWLDFAIDSYKRFPLLLDVLAEAAPALDFAKSEAGLVRLAMSDAEVVQLKERLHWQASCGIEQTYMTREDLHRLEPRLGPTCLAGIVTAQESIAPMAFCEAMLKASGDDLQIQEADVTGLVVEGEKITGVKAASGDTFCAEDVVIAGGVWSGEIAEQLRLPFTLVPVRGQIMTFAQPSPRLERVWWGPGYLIPRGSSFLFGATVERVGFDEEVTEDGRESLFSSLEAMMPSLAKATPTRHWSGLRPQTTDDMPIIGALPGLRGGWIAAGHFRNGVLLAPATAHWLAESIVSSGGSTTARTRLAAFSPERFSQ